MSNEAASLVMSIDSSGVKTAVVDLDKLTATAEKAEAATNRITQASAKSSAGYNGLTQATAAVSVSAEKYIKTMQAELDMLGRTRAEMERYNAGMNGLDAASARQVEAIAKKIEAYHREEQVMKDVAGAQDKAAAAADKFIAQLKYETETASLTTKELAAYKAAKLGVSDAAAPLIAAMKEGGHAMDGFSLSSSVAKRELMVMSRELARGDFTKLGSSFSIFAQSSGLMAMAMTPLGLAIGGVAAAAGLAAFAFYQGSKESHAYTEAIINTGNYAGVTKGQLTDMSAAVAKTVGSQHEAADALAQLGATGRISGTDLAAFAVTAVHAAESSGVAIKDTVAEFVKLGQDPVKESARLNESMHYLTGAVFEQINSLVALGKTDEAATLAQKTYADAVDERAKQIKTSLGYLEIGWHSIGKAASNAWSAMMGVGRDLSISDQIAKLQGQIVTGQAGSKTGSIFDKGPVGAGSFNDEQNKKIQEQIALLQSTQRETQKLASLDGERAKIQEKSIDGQKLIATALEGTASKTEKMNKELDSTKRAFDAIRAADPTSPLLQKESGLLDAIQVKYAEKATAQKKGSDAYGTMLASIAKANEAALLELSTDEKLTASDRFRIQTLSQIDEMLRKKNITVAQSIDLKQKESTAEANMAAVFAAAEAKKATEALTKAHEQYIGVLENTLNTTQADTDKLRQQTAELGLSKEAIAGLRAAEMDRQATATDGLAIDALVNNRAVDSYNLLVQTAAAIRAKSAAMRDFGAAETAVDQAKKLKDSEVKLLESVDKAAESAFINIAENGSNAFKKIGKTLQTAVLDLLYQLTVKKFIVNIAGSVTGAGTASIAQAAGAGVGSFGSLANSASSIYSAFSGGGLGSTAAGLLGSGVGAISGGVAGNAALGGALGLGEGAAVAAATAAAEAGGIALTAGTTAVATGAASLGAGLAAAAGPIGLAIAAVALLPSISNALFGGDRQNTGRGIEGNLGRTGFAGNSFSTYKQDGGFFGSDSTGKETSGLDSATSDRFSSSFNAIKMAASSAAVTLGLSANAITDYSERISVQLGSDTAANEKAIAALFSGLGDRLSATVAPGLSAFSRQGETASATLARLAGSLSTANAWLDMLGQKLLAVSLSGGETASKLADAFGGIDKLAAASKSFYDTYYTQSERAARSTEDMTKVLGEFGIALPASKDAFRAVATGLDLTTESGRKAYAAMLTLAPEFSATTDAFSAMAKDAAKAIEGLFAKVSEGIKSEIDKIASERAAVAAAALQINAPDLMSRDAILRGIAGTSLATPGNAGLSAAQGALGQADAAVAAQAAAVAYAKMQTPSRAALDNAEGTLGTAKNATQSAQSEVDRYRSIEDGKFNRWIDQALAGNDLRGTVPNPSGERNAQNTVFNLQDAQRNQQPAQAAYDAQLAAYSEVASVNATQVATAQAKLNAATAAQTVAVEAARAAQAAYLSSLQDFAIDATKSAAKLGTLREETLKYYEAQKQLADLMTTSAANLRGAVATARNGQLDPAQSLAQQKSAFSSDYSMALSTSGATQAGFADKLAAALPGLNTSLMAASSTRTEWVLASSKLFAQSQTIADQLSANAPKDYVADSLALLGQIDAALSVLDGSSKSAEKVIADAVTAGSASTANGLRAVIAALTGKSVPAFAMGGDFDGGLRLVGEQGPELEATGPSRIFTANQTRSMLGGSGDTGQLETLVKALTLEVQGLRAEARATAVSSNKTARLLSRVTRDGESMQTVAAAA